MRHYRRSGATAVASLVAISIASTKLLGLSFTPTYTGGTTEQQNATTSALNSLAAYFGGTAALPVSIEIKDLNSSSTLGTSSIGTWTARSGVYYPSPLYNVLDSVNPIPAITISMNINTGISWEFGATTPTGGKYSWQSVVMHEALHSMGFYDGIANSTGALAQAGYTVFDTLTTIGINGPAFSTLTSDADRKTQITSQNLYWGGTAGKAANGGNPVKLYAPGTFEEGSTYSHIDPTQTGKGGLLFPALGADTYFAGPTTVELGIMKDIGWTLAAVPEPSAYAAAFGGMSLAFGMWRRRNASKPSVVTVA